LLIIEVIIAGNLLLKLMDFLPYKYDFVKISVDTGVFIVLKI